MFNLKDNHRFNLSSAFRIKLYIKCLLNWILLVLSISQLSILAYQSLLTPPSELQIVFKLICQFKDLNYRSHVQVLLVTRAWRVGLSGRSHTL